MSTKVQCDLCRLSYSTEKELLDHSLSLMHHTKLEDREKNSLHECPLCSVICSNMADYRRHISTDAHQKNLSDFKGDKDSKNDIYDNRKSIQTSKNSPPSSSWSEDANINNKKQYRTDISSHGSRIQDQHNRKHDQLNKDHQGGSHFRFDHGKYNMPSQKWNSDSWKDRYNYRNDVYHWSKDGYLSLEHSRDTNRKGCLQIPHGQKDSNTHSGTRVSSGYYKFNGSGDYSGMSGWQNGQGRKRVDHAGHGFDDPSDMDFTTDVMPSDWDENSFLEHELFLHGVDTPYHPDKYQSVRTSSRTDNGKWEESSVRDRKRPRNEDDVQELLVKSSRSVNSFSHEHFPVRDVPSRHSVVLNTSSTREVKPASNAPTEIKIQTKISSIDNASNNILERAERLCKELRQKREASEALKNLQLTKENHESLNQKMSALVQKQQMHFKINSTNSQKNQSEERYNSSSSKQLQENGKVAVLSPNKISTDSAAPELQLRASENKLTNIKKSVEKGLLEIQKPGTNINTSVAHRSKQRSLSGGDTDLGKNKKGKDGVIDITGKHTLHPMSKLLLNKDNLKKMVNTPNSRDERLQLVKMLHSRMEQKTTTTGAPRTHLQLEGLYDSVFASPDVNLDLGQTFDSQTIKLENLSESVRQQILDLIDSDVSSQPMMQSESGLKQPNGLLKKAPVTQEDVIVLSDDEERRNVRKNKKNSARKMSGSSTSSILGDAAKTNKKKKIITEPSSNVGLHNSFASCNSKSSLVNHIRNSRPTSPVQKSNKITKDATMRSANDVLIISHSSDLELGKRKNTFPKEKVLHNSSKTLSNSKQNPILVNSRDCKSDVGLSSQNHSQLVSCSIREKFPTLLNIPKTDRVSPVKKSDSLVLSQVAAIRSSRQNAADKSNDVSPAFFNTEADIRAVSPKADMKSALIQIDQQTPSTVGSTEQPTLETQKSHKFALPSGTWMINRASPLHNYESQHIPFTARSSAVSNENLMSDVPTFSSAFKESTFKDTSSMDLLLLSDLDQSSADGARLSVGDVRTGSAHFSVGTSQTMSTLLMLSEKEEYVKQEKMSMDLRLCRLHRLLEQAVVQINKCTEQMNKLHEEEQELLKKRLTLLRVATALQPSQRSDVLSENKTPLEMKSHNKSENAGVDIDMENLSSSSGTRSFGSLQPLTNSTNPTITVAENVHGTSLSKDDWLAKFASYLPQDSATTSSKITESVSFGNTSGLKEESHKLYSSLPMDSTFMKLNLSKSQSPSQCRPERDVPYGTVDVEKNSDKTHTNTFLNPELSDHLSQVSSSAAAVADKQRGGMEFHTVGHSTVTSTNTLPVTASGETLIHNLISAPIMYVGSFRSTDHSMRLISPFVLERSETTPLKPVAEISNNPDSDRNLMMPSCQRREDGDIPTHDSGFADLIHLPSPSRSHNTGKNSEYGGEESDIGSVASSMASGSSLGEQITWYCRSTPGASLESRDPYGAHELSVIMSDTSEQRGLDSSAEEANDKSDSWLQKEHWHINVRPCSVSLERLDRKCIYGSLDEKAVRSAEALHLIERNCEATVGQLGIGLDNEKRRKRKTKQERDTTGFTRRRSHWITVSSSEDEGSGSSQQRFNSDIISSAVFRTKKSGLSSSVEKSDHSVLKTVSNNIKSESDDVLIVEHQSPSKLMDSSDVTIDNLKFLSPRKSASYLDVTVAECDSSTSMGAVDSESNFQASTWKGMRKNFDQLSDLSPKSSFPDIFPGVNSSTTDVMMSRNGSLLSRPSSSLSNIAVSDSHMPIPASGDSGLKLQSARTSQPSGMPPYSNLSETRHSDCFRPKIASGDWKASREVGDEIKSACTSVNNCHFPSGYGPVFDILVVKGQMYVGHINRGVHVYNMNGLNQGNVIKEYSFAYLQCMACKEHDEAVTLILGSGSDLVFCNSNEQSQRRYNLGTTIKCLLLSSHLVYAGLDTGEICVFDTLRMVLKDRCICSDHPIHCLASGKEGAVKLLCVSSQDGTIIVVDAQQFLPIRILTGHSKTAFSIQVEGHLVFSGSGDHTVLIQNLHTAAVEHVYSDSKGLVKSVCYSRGFLFTGGMDKLVRCYDIKTHKLVQVYYGADRGVITKILVLDNMLITGNISGSVDVVDIDIEARHRCHIAGCTLTFGNQSHLRWHILKDHTI